MAVGGALALAESGMVCGGRKNSGPGIQKIHDLEKKKVEDEDCSV